MRRILAVAACSIALSVVSWPFAPAGLLAADISALLARAGAAEKGGDHAEAIAALEQALEKVRAEAPLTVKPFAVVASPAKFYGDYTPRKDAEFRSGEAQHYYLEPKNLVYARNAAGGYEPAFEVDLKILSAAGETVAGKERFASFRLPTRSPVHDIFLNLRVGLSGVPAGQYRVQFVVRDLNSKKTATVTQPITMK